MHEDFDCRVGEIYLEDTLQSYARTARVPIDEIQWLPASPDDATCGCVISSEEQQIYWPIEARVLADTQYCFELARRAEVVVQELQRGLSRPRT